MKIKQRKPVPWNEVTWTPGDVFRDHEGEVWMVTQENHPTQKTPMCVNLKNGEMGHGWDSLKVEPLPLAQVVC